MTSPARGSTTDLRGRTALVSGAGSGLGRAIAKEYARCGARVILAGRDRSKLAHVAAECGADVREAICDVSVEASVATLVDELSEEEISILVNNAGIAGPVARLTEIDVAAWDEVFGTNVRGVFLMCRAFLPPMIERGRGDIINIASVSGKRPLARRTPYTASKMAVIGLTATLAHEVGPSGVMVNSLSPGPVAGDRMTRVFAEDAKRTDRTPEAVEQEFVSRAALQRMVTEQEVAAAARAILAMPGLCGADIDLSGGMIAR